MPHLPTQKLAPQDFVGAFGEAPSAYLAERINAYNFEFRPFSRNERDAYLKQIVEALCSNNLRQAGDARIGEWERGWGAHIEKLKEKFEHSAIVPGYFGKYQAVRWQQDLIQPVSLNFEYNSYAVIQDWVFDKYLRDVASVYEFGCGTGHNLLRVRAVNRDAHLYGLDWTEASQQVIQRIAHLTGDKKLHGRRFNLAEPDAGFKLDANAGVYTAASLEQLGDRFKPFIAYLLKQKPKVVIHIEPIAELLDPRHLLDYLSVTYFERRNYLKGLVDHLRALEQQGSIKILEARRTTIGSLFIEGYSVVVWSPT